MYCNGAIDLSKLFFKLLGGSSEIIQFKTVMLDALSKLFITSKLGNEISLQVKFTIVQLSLYL